MTSLPLPANKFDQDCDDHGLRVPSTSLSHLYHLLLDHTTRLYNDGTSTEEIETFLNDHDAISALFKSKWHVLDSGDPSTGQRNSDEPVGTTDDRDDHNDNPVVTEVEKIPGRSPLSKIFRVLIYFIICGVTALGTHIVLCHLLDANPLHHFPSLQESRCLLPAHPVLMEMTRPVADCNFCQGGDIIVEMKSVPSKDVFAKVAYLSKPVIIRGGGQSGGMPTAFNFHNLKDIFQSEPGGVDAVSDECQFLPFRSPFTNLREAFDMISKNSSWTEPWYIGWSNCHPGVAAKLRVLFPRPSFLPEDSSSSAIDWIFIGSPGLGASMHIDYVKRPSWQAQLSGNKRWILHPPPECESSCPESITFTIYPGDLLFLETNTWYHETHIDSDSFSISIGSEYD